MIATTPIVFSSTYLSSVVPVEHLVLVGDRHLSRLDVPVVAELLPADLHARSSMIRLGFSVDLPAALRARCQRRLSASPPSMHASEEPIVEVPIASSRIGCVPEARRASSSSASRWPRSPGTRPCRPCSCRPSRRTACRRGRPSRCRRTSRGSGARCRRASPRRGRSGKPSPAATRWPGWSSATIRSPHRGGVNIGLSATTSSRSASVARLMIDIPPPGRSWLGHG